MLGWRKSIWKFHRDWTQHLEACSQRLMHNLFDQYGWRSGLFCGLSGRRQVRRGSDFDPYCGICQRDTAAGIQKGCDQAGDAWPRESASWQEVMERVSDAGYSILFLPHPMVSGRRSAAVCLAPTAKWRDV